LGRALDAGMRPYQVTRPKAWKAGGGGGDDLK